MVSRQMKKMMKSTAKRGAVRLLTGKGAHWSYLLFGLVLILFPGGCSRQKYRTSADKEVYGLLNTVDQQEPLWKMDHFTLDQDGRSRYANVYDPDKQPMPQDDAVAHRLMQKVDGKKGSKKWYKNGCTQSVENRRWTESLPVNADGQVVLDQDTAFDLALIHSPVYRTALENVYEAALSVTAERFAFDTKFYGGDSLLFNNNGGFRDDSTSTLVNNIGPGSASAVASKKLATGGEIMANIANSMVWTFQGGDNSFTPTTTLGYSITQPLLRGAGRQIVLEKLTRSERHLLASVRQLAFFQQGFYVGVLTGTMPVSTPAASGYSTKGVGSVSRGGYYGLLSSQVQIRNQRAQVKSLKENLDQYEEYFKASKLSNSLQVEQVRSQFLSGQSTLVSLVDNYENSIENYLITLGLPPDIQHVVVQDSLLNQFTLMSPTMTDLYDHIDEMIGKLHNRSLDTPTDIKEKIEQFRRGIDSGDKEIAVDFEQLNRVVPSRQAALEMLRKRLEVEQPDLDRSFCDHRAFMDRIDRIRKDYIAGKQEMDDLFRLIDLTVGRYQPAKLAEMIEQTRENPNASPFDPETVQLINRLRMEDIFDKENLSEEVLTTRHTGEPDDETAAGPVYNIKEPYRFWVSTCLSSLAEKLTTIRLIQSRIRLETVELPIVDINSTEAFQVARECRFDWMNARSELVDSWRNIEIVANNLKGSMSVAVSGQIQNEGQNPVNFSANQAEMSASVKFDAPLTRLLERNEYRRALIAYDQARRSYYTYVDKVNLQIRETLREIYLKQMDLELKRESVRVAVIQVHQAQLKLAKPATSASRSVGDTSARDLVDALNTLLNSQNNFMTTWLDYQVQRMSVLLQLGLFEIDEHGRWIDPGSINNQFLIDHGQGNLVSQDELFGMNRLEDVESLTGGVSADALRSITPSEPEQTEAGTDTAENTELPEAPETETTDMTETREASADDATFAMSRN